ncbi:MAG: HepT-like ribonuclease domain-containing protein [bacterium]
MVPPDLAACLSRMARLRSLLVHAYGRVDDARVHGILRTHLADLEAFLENVGKAVARDVEG